MGSIIQHIYFASPCSCNLHHLYTCPKYIPVLLLLSILSIFHCIVRYPHPHPITHVQDSDVSAERKRVASGATTEDEVIVIKNLVKVRMYVSSTHINVISNHTTSPRFECVASAGQ